MSAVSPKVVATRAEPYVQGLVRRIHDQS